MSKSPVVDSKPAEENQPDPRDRLLMATAKAVLHVMSSQAVRAGERTELESAIEAVSKADVRA
jgi:hypothetical protein